MPIEDDPAQPPTADGAEATPTDDAEEREKVIVRSNGTVTYVGKDMAYQFWKSGCSATTSTIATFADAAWTATAVGDDQRSGAGGRRPSAVRRRGRRPTT